MLNDRRHDWLSKFRIAFAITTTTLFLGATGKLTYDYMTEQMAHLYNTAIKYASNDASFSAKEQAQLMRDLGMEIPEQNIYGNLKAKIWPYVITFTYDGDKLGSVKKSDLEKYIEEQKN